MSLDFDLYKDIYLVFMNTNYLLDFLFKDGFKHVYVIERQALGWTCIDPSKSDTAAFILPASYQTDVISELVKQNPTFTILHLHVKPHTNNIYPNLGIISCVSIVQYILGVYWPYIFTPYQLYCKIKHEPPNHIEVIEWHDTNYTKHKEKHTQQLNKQKN